MVAQWRHWIFPGRRAMRVSDWAHRRIAHGRGVNREESLFADLPVVECGNFHDEVMRMLSVIDRAPKGRFTLLEKLGVETICDGRRLQAQHGTKCELPGTQ